MNNSASCSFSASSGSLSEEQLEEKIDGEIELSASSSIAKKEKQEKSEATSSEEHQEGVQGNYHR